MNYIINMTNEKKEIEKAYNNQKYFVSKEYKDFIEKGDIIYIRIEDEIKYKMYTNERSELELLIKYNKLDKFNIKNLERKLNIKLNKNVIELNKELEQYIYLVEIKNIASLEILPSVIPILNSNIMFLKYKLEEHKNEIKKIENKINAIYRLEETIERLNEKRKNVTTKSSLIIRDYITNSDKESTFELFLLKAILKSIDGTKEISIDNVVNELFNQYDKLYEESYIRLNKYTVSKIQNAFKKYKKNIISKTEVIKMLKNETNKKINNYSQIFNIEENKLIIINEEKQILNERLDLIEEIVYILKGALREINMDRVFTENILDAIE